MRTLPRELADFRELGNSRGAELRKLSYSELKDQKGRVEDVVVKSRPATIATIVETQADNSICVVLQGFMPGRLLSSLKNVALDGFYKYPEETVKAMSEDELSGFD